MNTLKNTTKTLFKTVIITSTLLFTVSAYAAHSVKIETKSSKSAYVTNVSANMHGNSLSIKGKLRRTQGGHLVIPGNIKLELLDENGNVLKTVTTSQRRHMHRVNRAYIFSASIPLESHDDVNMVRVTHDRDAVR